ncbi:glycosyltransferase family 2 protein [Hypericibacter adhaerens]|uniref:glycosyltransferase family 2 protein n=1 Tax=Hypericibacter adhaerens TaxID=2602016 RepID=UPI00177C1B28|nr:glycosyltransferase family 2 protein [Hypericibacter adhaerens]
MPHIRRPRDAGGVLPAERQENGYARGMVMDSQVDRPLDHILQRVRCQPTPSPDATICMIVARNEELRLPDCLRHHRKLGVDRFVIVDNDSSDGTSSYLRQQPDVDLWSTRNSYGESGFGGWWYYSLAEQYGFGRWYLLIDADELLVYPDMENRGLRDVARRLTELGVYAMRAPMIDMYPDKPLDSIEYRAGDSLIEACPFFDGDSYYIIQSQKGRTLMRGGPRQRLLSTEERPFTVSLEKFPFRFWVDGTPFRHHASPFPTLRTPPIGALLHFKFLDDLGSRIDAAVSEGEHWNGAAEYIRYKEKYEALRSPFYEGSARYEGPDSLVRRGIIARFPW